jgi:hypothetical protein
VLAEVVVSTRLTASADEVWAAVTTPAGVNYELRPLLRMTIPGRWSAATLDEVPLNEPLGRSWILLGGVLPVDFDDLCLIERGPGHRFQEQSKTSTLSPWRHERTVIADGDGCTITDRLQFAPRGLLRHLPGMTRLASGVVRFLFGHRHRRLARRYGADR